uniref:Uncharacterized protein n=1 Tax=Solanum lycopersicum TaxID=4081 RepID=A0A3Q7GYR6_SOLLC
MSLELFAVCTSHICIHNSPTNPLSRRCEKIFCISFSNFRLSSLIVSIFCVLIRSLQQLQQYISDTEFGVICRLSVTHLESLVEVKGGMV